MSNIKIWIILSVRKNNQIHFYFKSISVFTLFTNHFFNTSIIKKDSNQLDVVEANNDKSHINIASEAIKYTQRLVKQIDDLIENGKSSKYSLADLSKECDHIIKAIYLMKNGNLNNFEDDNENVIVDVEYLLNLLDTKLNI